MPDRARALRLHYRAADYVVGTGQGFVLKVGRCSHPLRALQRGHGVSRSAFLTAWNPVSRRCSDAANQRAQQRLVSRLWRRGYLTLPGHGVDPAGAWPAEASVLVLGIPAGEACVLARQFGQNALLIMAADAVPRLAWVGRTSPGPGQDPVGSIPTRR